MARPLPPSARRTRQRLHHTHVLPSRRGPANVPLPLLTMQTSRVRQRLFSRIQYMSAALCALICLWRARVALPPATLARPASCSGSGGYCKRADRRRSAGGADLWLREVTEDVQPEVHFTHELMVMVEGSQARTSHTTPRLPPHATAASGLDWLGGGLAGPSSKWPRAVLTLRRARARVALSLSCMRGAVCVQGTMLWSTESVFNKAYRASGQLRSSQVSVSAPSNQPCQSWAFDRVRPTGMCVEGVLSTSRFR